MPTICSQHSSLDLFPRDCKNLVNDQKRAELIQEVYHLKNGSFKDIREELEFLFFILNNRYFYSTDDSEPKCDFILEGKAYYRIAISDAEGLLQGAGVVLKTTNEFMHLIKIWQLYLTSVQPHRGWIDPKKEALSITKAMLNMDQKNSAKTHQKKSKKKRKPQTPTSSDTDEEAIIPKRSREPSSISHSQSLPTRSKYKSESDFSSRVSSLLSVRSLLFGVICIICCSNFLVVILFAYTHDSSYCCSFFFFFFLFVSRFLFLSL